MSLAFILAFIGAGVALLIGISIFSEVEGALASVVSGGGVPESEELLGQNTATGDQLIPDDTTNLSSIYTGLDSTDFITGVSIPVSGVELTDFGKGGFLLVLPADYSIGLYDSSDNLLAFQSGQVIADGSQDIEVTFSSPVQVPIDGIVAVGIKGFDTNGNSNIKYLGDTTISDFDELDGINDPIINVGNTDWFRVTSTDIQSFDCSNTGSAKDKSFFGNLHTVGGIEGNATALPPDNCSASIMDYSTVSIPDNAVIVKIELEIVGISSSTPPASATSTGHKSVMIGDFVSETTDTASVLWTDVITNSFAYQNGYQCTAPLSLQLSSSAIADLQSALTGDDTFGITWTDSNQPIGTNDRPDGLGIDKTQYSCILTAPPDMKVTYFVTTNGLPDGLSDPFISDGTTSSSQRTVITVLTAGSVNEEFAKASNIAYTVIGIIPVALFFFLFAIFGGRVE